MGFENSFSLISDCIIHSVNEGRVEEGGTVELAGVRKGLSGYMRQSRDLAHLFT